MDPPDAGTPLSPGRGSRYRVAMSLTARIIARRGVVGPAPLDLLAALACGPGEMALLHTSRADGVTVLAVEPVLTIEVDALARARWLTPSDIPEPDLSSARAGESAAVDPLAAWQRMLGAVYMEDIVSGAVPLVGWLGAISYDIARHIESLPVRAADDLEWPLLRWSLFDGYFVYDHRARTWTLATMEWSAHREELADQRLDRFESLLGSIEPLDEEPAAPRSTVAHAEARQDYLDKVQRVRDYIAAGDIYQANLAQRWTIDTRAKPENIYRRLCAASPAEFASFFRFDNRAIISASPELFLERRGTLLRTRPIKGTRPRDPRDATRDAALRDELLHSAKDGAELAMIVDLLRNDLGRVCSYGSVSVVNPRAIEEHPTVWHTVALLEGRLDAQREIGWGHLIAALCPGGSVTGAPKIRAMQIIEELEPVRRAVYCGNIGWIGPRDTGAMNIAIRTILMRGAHAYVYAGGGVVADSDPAAEYEETLDKARAPLAALGIRL